MFARSLLTVGVGTGASRVLGFVRDIMLAATLGSGAIADAFVVAFRLPNLFRRLLSEGALNPAFVPIYDQLRAERGARAADDFTGDAFVALALTLAAICAAAEVAMGVVVFLLAPGFAEDPEKFALTVTLSRLAFPFLFFASLAALLAGALNAAHRFTAAAFAPVVLNGVLVGVLAFVEYAGQSSVRAGARWLSIAVTIGGAAQLALCWIALRRAGLMWRWRRPRVSPELRRLLTLAIPGAFAGGIAQVNAFVGSIVGSQSPSAVSFLYYADRVYQLPLGVVGVAIGLVLLPALTRRLTEGDHAGARLAQGHAIEFALAVTAPGAVALLILAGPIVDVLFRRGAFDARAALETGRTLAAFAPGLPAYVLAKALQTAFFARADIRTPVIVALIGAAVDVVLSLALFPSLEHVGVALAATAAGWVNVVLLYVLMRSRGHYTPDAATLRRAGLVVAASVAMGCALILGAALLAPALAAGALARFAALAALCVAGLAGYALFGHAIGAFDLRAVRAALGR
ncbi:MAG: murein biosynthesis integral membrane protein MurJ [Methylobacteriaceae bacterium]|nr:murein biosynthesis integral membrane protein MurJ [Methylobacteriaceae bacterium]